MVVQAMNMVTVASGTLSDGGTFEITAYVWKIRPANLRYDIYFDGKIQFQNCAGDYAVMILGKRVLDAISKLEVPGEKM